MWMVFDEAGNVIARLDDLYEAEILAEATGGRIEMAV